MPRRPDWLKNLKTNASSPITEEESEKVTSLSTTNASSLATEKEPNCCLKTTNKETYSPSLLEKEHNPILRIKEEVPLGKWYETKVNLSSLATREEHNSSFSKNQDLKLSETEDQDLKGGVD